MMRVRLLVPLLGAAIAASALSAVGSAGATAEPSGLVLFVHPGSGGGWSSHVLDGVAAGASTPSIASIGGEVVLAERADNGDVSVAEGTLLGPFTTVDLSATLLAPQAAGAPVVTTDAGSVSVWYRTTLGDLEVATRATSTAQWTLVDVTTLTGGPTLLGDPYVDESSSAGPMAFAVVTGGIVEQFVPPLGALGSWQQSDPTSGLIYPALTGDVSVFDAPGAPGATVVLGTSTAGDVVELSDEQEQPHGAVGPWRFTDLTVDGAPSASGGLSAFGGSTRFATYDSWGNVEVLSLTSGLPNGFSVQNLSQVDQLWPSSDVAPTLVAMPNGVSVAAPSSTGDLLLVSISTKPRLVDTSFEPATGEYVASAVASTHVGGAVALVADDGGPIAPSSLRMRIAVLATSFDQEHGGYQTAPKWSDCNRFTASFGRGSSQGCPRGTASEAWCSDFAQYVWTHAGVPTGGISGWAASFITWGQQHHLVQMGTHFTPGVGDAIVWGQRSPLYGTHVAIIVAVDGQNLTIVSGNSPGGFPGDGIGVWRWGPFDGPSSTVNGYHVLGVVTP
jgi:hypothetical protein